MEPAQQILLEENKMENNHIGLKHLAERIFNIYPAISKMIHDYLTLASEGIIDSDTKHLEEKILHFLEELVKLENIEASYAFKEKNKAVLENIHSQIDKIKKLEHFIRVSESKLNRHIVELIDSIDKEIKRLILEEQNKL
ncbi:hypothetical protein COV93_03470 [Candidatus Woesearchaeota archaeon CG11_big_fil_rev_8_21_14_0_20_43_8]|nr:MAG: hypothetical protein COV93_03470 [Candidatus Woesearchaeota archaeon CG11_big_fil_rev_8_21_14_0_20_43_8]PIO05071.1 MAG: hypothetical protein COT47_06420 [Candidatus Woesearchaeota archaeon CG08_land_8_20_14_0_20_43_7]